MDGWTLPALLISGWLIVGVGVAVRLERAGQPAATSVSALVAWPLLWGLIGSAPQTGPFSARIAEAFSRLAHTLADPVAGDPPWATELASLQGSLLAADARLALVDRLLVDADSASAATELRAARDHAAGEIEAVLQGLVELRLQLGLYALEGGDRSVQEALAALQARASALSEVRATRLSR